MASFESDLQGGAINYKFTVSFSKARVAVAAYKAFTASLHPSASEQDLVWTTLRTAWSSASSKAPSRAKARHSHGSSFFKAQLPINYLSNIHVVSHTFIVIDTCKSCFDVLHLCLVGCIEVSSCLSVKEPIQRCRTSVLL